MYTPAGWTTSGVRSTRAKSSRLRQLLRQLVEYIRSERVRGEITPEQELALNEMAAVTVALSRLAMHIEDRGDQLDLRYQALNRRLREMDQRLATLQAEPSYWWVVEPEGAHAHAAGERSRA